MAYVPPPMSFIGKEAREGFYELLGQMRRAESDVELTLYVERYNAAAAEARGMFTMLEGVMLAKMKEFRVDRERGQAERAGDVPHIDRAAQKERRQGEP